MTKLGMEIIREARLSDSSAIAGIIVECRQKAYKNIIAEDILKSEKIKDHEKCLRNDIGKGLEETYVFEKIDKVCGFITIGKYRDYNGGNIKGEIWRLYVSPKYWHKGYGKRLLRHSEKLLMKRDLKTVLVWTLKDNKISRKFYENSGYKTDGGKKILEHVGGAECVRYYKDF